MRVPEVKIINLGSHCLTKKLEMELMGLDASKLPPDWHGCVCGDARDTDNAESEGNE